MGLFNKNNKYKRCPYCKTKNYNNVRYCNNCNLDFWQIENCTNSSAKALLKKRKFGETFEGEIVAIRQCPKDVSKKKLVLLTIFLGLFGAHSFYVGKYIKAWLSCILGILFVTCTIVVTCTVDLGIGIANIFFTAGLFIGIFPVVTYCFDLFAVIFNKYEIPILLQKPVDIPEEDE